MSKNLLQDMVRIKRSTQRSVPIKEKTKEKEKISNTIKENSGNKGSKYRIYFVALISVVFLLFALSFLFSGAKITLTPKVKEIPMKENLSVTKDGNLSDLSFDLMVIPGEESKTIQGGEEKDIAVTATGVVLVYNIFSSSPQVLDIDTRLEGSNGKIYKTNKKITVPGMIGNKPGSIEVGIYGASAGIEYNSTPLDFKIFGFKGTLKYSKFYARSKGEITGGFKGRSSVVSSLDKATAVSALKVTLKVKLLKKGTDQVPNGFILFKDAMFLNIDDRDIIFTPDKNNTVSVKIKGTLYGFIFEEKKLTKKIAQDIIDKYDGSEIYIPNIKDLTFSLSDKESVSFAEVADINFTLLGTPKIIWKINEEKFITDILGKKKKDLDQILSQYPDIDSVELILRPFWKTSFPEKSDSIEVIVNYPQ